VRVLPGHRGSGSATWGSPGSGSVASPSMQPAPSLSSSPSPSSPDPAQRLEACVASTVNGLSQQERVGQLLMVGTQVTDPTAIADTVRRYHLGGTFLAGRASPSAATLRQGIPSLQDAAGAIPLQIAIDQEGGQVQTLKGNDFPLIPSAVEQGKWDDATLRARTADCAKRLTAPRANH